MLLRHLPSLETLRAFEAAGRHQNFSKAAAELNVTHGAVSQRLRELEARIGARLFERSGNSMLLTAKGKMLLVEIGRILDDLARCLDAVRDRDEQRSLKVSVPPAFSGLWLFPRLFDFVNRHPDIDVDIVTDAAAANFREDGVDLAVRFGAGIWPGLQATRLLEEEFFPVCTPRLRDAHGPRVPADMLCMPLLKDDWIPWDVWFRVAGLVVDTPLRGPSFSDATLLLRAATEGHGVALGRGTLLRDDLAAGRLVRLFDVSAHGPYAYYIVCPPASHDLPKIRLFRDWLLAQAGGATHIEAPRSQAAGS
ncbi:transcriptional regulator GcvA [Bradyrhizobium sp. U87765 SZCCT0131]|uniref:transcriptional regulator GcvA n=1 Tax=unclassified Bradyrhizobium TaxID=2631580 RepID=UPI001BA4A25D|nr:MULTISPECIES: transcriptional regulator GcvA [unclassified Bradyrhizobium]MBR1218989.1 transcriptional regulator GcvA [Bradyrhizobium sp. U87765 SZCCT0131]MBR1261640.1 transcriptional regulator GcvA [Bradyrhizobium sp. U87765 SZCCT0134]MBR1306507.1 transcriptional regulator GcvA [Bradyrhizobium sp. U87765 SZCCT0110]MBR1317422.1 transcriptional regulator GcvA [Bradyrhizobium sp. U87765 SZCCT0109]MBR1351124.1 transcriptional regulator GcvA [Bradyrhizobium sp. U87765 SZCCT0048]